MDHEEPVELESWAIAHQFPSPKDHNVVYGNCERAFEHRRHRSYLGLEVEVLRAISHHGREGLVEDGP